MAGLDIAEGKKEEGFSYFPKWLHSGKVNKKLLYFLKGEENTEGLLHMQSELIGAVAMLVDQLNQEKDKVLEKDSARLKEKQQKIETRIGQKRKEPETGHSEGSGTIRFPPTSSQGGIPPPRTRLPDPSTSQGGIRTLPPPKTRLPDPSTQIPYTPPSLPRKGRQPCDCTSGCNFDIRCPCKRTENWCTKECACLFYTCNNLPTQEQVSTFLQQQEGEPGET